MVLELWSDRYDNYDTHLEWVAAVLGLAGPEITRGVDLAAIRGEMAAPQDRTTMQVVGLGFGRTGSTSLSMALEILGLNPVHDDEFLDNADLFEAEEEDEITEDELVELLGRRGYNASFKTDFKWAKRHPEVKAILTVSPPPPPSTPVPQNRITFHSISGRVFVSLWQPCENTGN